MFLTCKEVYWLDMQLTSAVLVN